MNYIPYGRQNISEADIASVVEILKSNFLTQGPTVPKFEKTVMDYCNVRHAIAVNSATSALHIACLALGVTKGDRVWTSPITFVSTANCALYCQADIDFVDIDAETYNMSIKALEVKLKKAKLLNQLPKVIIPVHLCGESCDMEKIYQLSLQYGFKIIEDASHAIGGKYKNKFIGNCEYSNVTIFSFHPVKIITTGEGGMATTNDSSLARKMELLRSHGITRDFSEMPDNLKGPWYYEQVYLGFNYRMTDIQAALGISQMQRINEFVIKRQQIANKYDHFLKNLPIKRQKYNTKGLSSLHLYVIRLNTTKIKKSHKKIFEEIRLKGIGINLHYIPVYHHPYYQKLNFEFEFCEEAEKYYKEAISLPIFPDISDEELINITNVIKDSIN